MENDEIVDFGWLQRVPDGERAGVEELWRRLRKRRREHGGHVRVSVSKAAKLLDLSEWRVGSLVARGKLDGVFCNGRRFVFGDSIEEYAWSRPRGGLRRRWRRWSEAEDSLLGSQVDEVVAKKLGRKKEEVRTRRMRLGILAAEPAKTKREWTAEEEGLLGTGRDELVAQRLGRKIREVAVRRRRLGIRAWREAKRREMAVTARPRRPRGGWRLARRDW